MTNDRPVQAHKPTEEYSSEQHKPVYDIPQLVQNGQDHQMKNYGQEHEQGSMHVYAQQQLAIQQQMMVNGPQITMSVYDPPAGSYLVDGSVIISPQPPTSLDYTNNPNNFLVSQQAAPAWHPQAYYSSNMDYPGPGGMYPPTPNATGPIYPSQFVYYQPIPPPTGPTDPGTINGNEGVMMVNHGQQSSQLNQQQTQSSINPTYNSYPRNSKPKTDFTPKPYRPNGPSTSKYPSNHSQSSTYINRNHNQSNGTNERSNNYNNGKAHEFSTKPRQQRPPKSYQQISNSNNNTKPPKEPTPQPAIDLNSQDFLPLVSTNPMPSNGEEGTRPIIPGGRSYSSVVSTNLTDTNANANEVNQNSTTTSSTPPASTNTNNDAPSKQQSEQLESRSNNSSTNDKEEQVENPSENTDRIFPRITPPKPKQKSSKNAKQPFRQPDYNQKFTPVSELNGGYVSSTTPPQLVTFSAPYQPSGAGYVYAQIYPNPPYSNYNSELLGEYNGYPPNDVQPDIYSFNFELNDPKVLSKLRDSQYFIIKSYSKDNVIHSIRNSIWCSTNHGNAILNEAFDKYYREYETDVKALGGIYLLFSVNASGNFCGVAKLLSRLDESEKAKSQWAHSKWEGAFNIEWLMIKNVPNSCFRKITLENNEGKPVTNSRDAQEVPSEKAIEVLRIMQNYPSTSSILNQTEINYDSALGLSSTNANLAPSSSLPVPSYPPVVYNMPPANTHGNHHPKFNPSPRYHGGKNFSSWNIGKSFTNHEYYGPFTPPTNEFHQRHAHGGRLRPKQPFNRPYDEQPVEQQPNFTKILTKNKLNNGENNETNTRRSIKKKEVDTVEESMERLKIDSAVDSSNQENSTSSSASSSSAKETSSSVIESENKQSDK